MAGGALAPNAIAQDVLDVGARGAEVAADDARVAGLDDHTAAAWSDQPGSRANAGAHASFQAGRRNVTSLPQSARTLLSGLTEYQCRMALRSRLPGIANATELGIELVFSHTTSRAVHRALRDVPPAQIFKMASKTALKSQVEFAHERHGWLHDVAEEAVFARPDAEMTSPLYPDLQKTARGLPHTSYRTSRGPLTG